MDVLDITIYNSLFTNSLVKGREQLGFNKSEEFVSCFYECVVAETERTNSV